MRPKRADDREILDALLARGDTPTTPRDTIVFFYKRKDEARNAELVFNPLAQRLHSAGWAITGLDSGGLIAASDRPADAASVDALSDEMEALAAEFGVDFDGWECA